MTSKDTMMLCLFVSHFILGCLFDTTLVRVLFFISAAEYLLMILLCLHQRNLSSGFQRKR